MLLVATPAGLVTGCPTLKTKEESCDLMKIAETFIKLLSK